MFKIELRQIPRYYKNNGQHAEQVARFTLTGKIERADNRPFTAGGDIGGLQVKSARATVCKGTDLQDHFKRDGATSYGYVTSDFRTMYIMDRIEYAWFVIEFGTITRDSRENGGQTKMRLKHETDTMREWLESRV